MKKKNRFYLGYFVETPIWKNCLIRLKLALGEVDTEPHGDIIVSNKKKNKKIYLFNSVSAGQDLFGELRNHQTLIIHELNKILTPKMKSQLSVYKIPVIGVHIRRGDFKLGNQTTSLDYFIQAINLIRKTLNAIVPVTIFTDAEKSELYQLIELPDINIAEDKPDILDMLLLSKSRIMILSQSSTFSYWAAFLSDAVVIRPINDWQKVIKHSTANDNYEEVLWHFENDASSQKLIDTLSNSKL